ncbi:MAG: hypothetical protein U9P73_03625 [Candidatus Cloacimonadota bacterium]|nr:hypothetical protein [Candidatus Cloacimonadota bacterium]
MWKYILIIAVLFILFGCDTRTTNPDNMLWAWLHVFYNDNLIYDEVMDETDNNQTYTLDLPDDSQITFDKFVNIHYGCPPNIEENSRSYIVWAKKADYFTHFTSGSYLDTLQINASGGFTPVIQGEVCGTIYTTSHIPFTNYKFYILQDSVVVDSITTSSNGYFNIDIVFGNYQICVSDFFDPQYFEEFNIDSFYDDYIVIGVSYSEKPNIYLYPREQMDLDVNIIFPHGGEITTSIPNYGNGWKNLQIEPSGLINGNYNYLFYESQNPDLCQYKEGWVIAQEDLENFFTQNLAETGFKGQEIIDFTDYWIPLLTDYPYYAIYPQYKEQLNKMVELEFSIEPDNLLRLLYSVEGLQENSLILPEPEIPGFKREGFVVVEWGVIRKFKNQDIITINDY